MRKLQRRVAGSTRERTEAAIALAREHGFAQRLAAATILRGWALSMQGWEEGTTQMHQGLATLRATGTAAGWPYYLALLAEAYGQMGQAPEGLRTPDEARTVVQDTKERVCEAELHRFRAELQLIQAGETPHARTMAVEAEAETYFHQALAIARRQGAKSLEL